MPVVITSSGGFGGGAILRNDRAYDIVDGFEVFGLASRVPAADLQDVVAGLRLPLGRHGQQVLVAIGGDEIIWAATRCEPF